jgi:hypothetical protein
LGSLVGLELVVWSAAKSRFLHQHAGHWDAADVLRAEVERKEMELVALHSSAHEAQSQD